MATLYDMLNGVAEPAPLPNVNPQGVTQAGTNMATMGAQPSPVTNPQPQPPATPEEFNARKNGWMQALDALRANPAAQQAMMFTAARLLNGPRFGQSQGGVIGEAAFGGMSMYNQLQENASEQQLKQREAERRDQLVGAQTEDIRSQTETRRAKAPLDLRKMDLELRKIETEVQRMEDPTSLENNKRLLENLIMAYSNQEIEDNPELAKRVARAALLKQEVENTYKDRLGSAAAERADKVGSTGGTDDKPLKPTITRTERGIMTTTYNPDGTVKEAWIDEAPTVDSLTMEGAMQGLKKEALNKYVQENLGKVRKTWITGGPPQTAKPAASSSTGTGGVITRDQLAKQVQGGGGTAKPDTIAEMWEPQYQNTRGGRTLIGYKSRATGRKLSVEQYNDLYPAANR